MLNTFDLEKVDLNFEGSLRAESQLRREELAERLVASPQTQLR